MSSPPANANGHRRRELRRRVFTEETHCALCGEWVNKALERIPGKHGPNCHNPQCHGCAWHPDSPVVDEDLPRKRGGSPYSRDNCHLMHRHCNRAKGTHTIAEYKTKHANKQKTINTFASAGW